MVNHEPADWRSRFDHPIADYLKSALRLAPVRFDVKQAISKSSKITKSQLWQSSTAYTTALQLEVMLAALSLPSWSPYAV